MGTMHTRYVVGRGAHTQTELPSVPDSQAFSPSIESVRRSPAVTADARVCRAAAELTGAAHHTHRAWQRSAVDASCPPRVAPARPVEAGAADGAAQRVHTTLGGGGRLKLRGGGAVPAPDGRHVVHQPRRRGRRRAVRRDGRRVIPVGRRA
eukprot:6296865-Prymnesium_polylepis.1